MFMRGGHLAEIEAAQRITFVARYAGKAAKARQASKAGPGNWGSQVLYAMRQREPSSQKLVHHVITAQM